MAPKSFHLKILKIYILIPFIMKAFPTEKMQDPHENFFNELNKQNFECPYLFPNEIESFLSGKEKSETINAIHVNIRSLSKNFDNLLDILTLFWLGYFDPPYSGWGWAKLDPQK